VHGRTAAVKRNAEIWKMNFFLFSLFNLGFTPSLQDVSSRSFSTEEPVQDGLQKQNLLLFCAVLLIPDRSLL
jgi:hypothetical protein